jgi:hypothetical protein
MDRIRHLLPALAAITGLAWMGAVLFVAANPKGIDLAGDLAYDRANRTHTLALVLLLATAILVERAIRTGALEGRRSARVLVIGAALMPVGNAVSFWGALVVGEQSDRFWGGWAGWLTYLPGELLVLGAFIALARAARSWPVVGRAQRWTIGSVGVLLSVTSVTWAISPAVTLVPALLATFALWAMGTAVANAATAGLPTPSAGVGAHKDAAPAA